MGIKDDANDRKKALIDSSSTILLYKSHLLEYAVSHYNLIMAQSVFEELTRNLRAGSNDVKQHRETGMITVTPTSQDTGFETVKQGILESLGRGERDTIILFMKGCGNFIIMDDGKGAIACRKNQIPFINTLLVPRILRIAGKLSVNQCEEMIGNIMDCGRYSEQIIAYAKTCPDEALFGFV